MTERRLGIMIFSGHFYAQNLDFHGGAEFETIPWVIFDYNFVWVLVIMWEELK